MQRYIIDNSDSYVLDDKQGIIQKKYMDGMLEPNDFPTYAHYFLQQKAKTNSVDEARLVFSDLSSEQIATSFLMSTPPERRKQLMDEISFGVLFETANWLAS